MPPTPSNLKDDSHKESDNFDISRMNDAISILVPLSLMDATELSNIAALLYFANLVDDFEPPEQFENVKFTAKAHMTTDQYNRRFPKGFDPDVNRVPTVPLWVSEDVTASMPKKGFLSTNPASNVSS